MEAYEIFTSDSFKFLPRRPYFSLKRLNHCLHYLRIRKFPIKCS